jgi:anti-sigma regulatory factor (Ser/Thr protein kinase)
MEIVRHRVLVPADMARLCELRDYLARVCEQQEVPSKTTRRLVLAIDEALSNVIEHASLKDSSKQIELSLEFGEDKIVAEIVDNGIPFDPSPYNMGPNRRNYPRRGFGLYLIHMIVDQIQYERTSDGRNVLTLTKSME